MSREARVEQVLDLLTRLAGGEVDARIELSPDADDLDGIAAALNMLGEELSASFVSKQALESIFDALGEAAFVVSATGLVESANAAARTLLDAREDDLVGQRLIDIVVTDDPVVRPSLEGGNTPGLLRCDAELSRREGPRVPVVLVVSPVPGASSKVVLATDMTDQRRQMSELASARAAAEESSGAKSRFLNQMSHEMQTPLTTVVGLCEALLSRSEALGLVAEVETDLKNILSAGKHLSGLVNDALTYAQGATGSLLAQPAPLDLPALLREISAVYADAAKRKGVQFETQLSNKLPGVAMLDAGKLRQIAVSLLSNAIKHTEPGKRVAFTALYGDEQLVLVIDDEGCGMSEDEQQRAFEAFERLGQRGQRAPGAGLGLPLARRLAEVLGGNLTLESEPSIGTIVSVRVPAPTHRSVPPVDSERLRKRVANRTVVIIDDSAVNCIIARRLLEQIGIRAEHFVKPAEGLQRLLASPPDLVLLDLNMPELDGYSLCREVRQFNTSMPIIAYTSDAFSEIRDRATEAGMNDVLCKPFQRHQLNEMLERYL